MINLKAAAQSVRAKDKEGEEKEQMISFHHSVFLYTELEILLLPVPHRVGRQRLLSDVCSRIASLHEDRTALTKHCYLFGLVVKGQGMFYALVGILPMLKNTN